MDQNKPKRGKKGATGGETSEAVSREPEVKEEAVGGGNATEGHTQAPIQVEAQVGTPAEVEEKREQERTRIKKQLFLDALRRMMGDIKASCEAIDIERKTFYRWRNDDPQFSSEIENIRLELRDDVESMAMRLIRKGDGPTIRHWLDRRHPDFKPTNKTEIISGTRTFEDLLYEMAVRNKALAEGKDPDEAVQELMKLEEPKETTQDHGHAAE